ncbi:MAG TPA: S1C family serine protease [Enhygromyxa sp.]|nr:S1C family serine protease [Enhygromyxa sp.]
MIARDKDAQEVADVEPEPAPEPTPTVDPTPTPTPGPTPEPVAPVEPDLGELYRKVGAATVVVRVPGSVGSGAVIDPSGIILTNHHVIDKGTREELSLKAKVVFGDYSEELYTFQPRDEQLDAWVIKVDEEHDLALLKLVNPPANLAYLKIAAENPHPGQRVAALGHAGVGMLWAIKGGEISAAGSLSGHADLLLDANEGDREYLEQMKKRFEKMGRVIQSTAKILPGDSGGPLVNLDSEIVGVNAFGRIDAGTNQWLSFHIHRSEVAAFVAEIPTRPLAVIPDPWDFAGPWSRVEDADLDGKADVLLISGELDGGSEVGTSGTLLDLDGDSFTIGGAPSQLNPKIGALVEDKRFDAEFAVLHEPRGVSHYLYDRDGVDGFDLYLLAEQGRVPTRAWSIDRHGGAEKLDSLELGNGLRPELFTDAKLATAFKDTGSRVFPGQLAADAANLPSPSHAVDGEVEFEDSDSDGLNDTLLERSAFDWRVFLDLDQSSIGRMVNADGLKVVLAVSQVDTELAVVLQTGNAWVFYDRDDDGTFDLVVHGDPTYNIATDAFTLAASGAAPVPAPEHVGRMLLRPALLNKPELAARLAKHPLASWTAKSDDDGLASFPTLAPGPNAAIVVNGRKAVVTDAGHDLTLVDVDGDSSKADDHATAALVGSGDFDAEFALLDYGAVVWAFYDRDGDGSFDWVLVSLDGQHDRATLGYAISGTTATLQASAAGAAMVSAEAFTDATLRAEFASSAGSL